MTVNLAVPQRDGGPYQWLNCNCAVTGAQIAFETGGAKHPSGSQVRVFVRNADGSPDRVGGTTPAQVVDAAKRGFGVTLDARNMDFDVAWSLAQSDRYAIGFSISYGPISGTKYDGSPGFRGNHQILVSGGLVYDPLADGRRAGIPTAPERWPKELVRRAAGALNVALDGYRALGEGRAIVVIAEAPTVKPARYSARFEPGSFWVYSVLNGHLGGRQARRFTSPTSAPCDPPALVDTRRLVRIQKGALAGRYVEPGSSHVSLVRAA